MKPLSLPAKIGAGSAVLVMSLVAAGLFRQLTECNPPIPPPAPLPKPNGFDLYLAAAGTLQLFVVPVDAIFDKTPRSPAEAARNYSPARRQKWLDANAQSWNLLAAALQTPTRSSLPRGADINVTRDYGPLRELARAQSVRAKNFRARGEWDAALSTGLDTWQMGRDIERGAPLIGSLVGIAVEAIAGRELEVLPSHLSANQARSGAQRLEKLIAGATPFSAVLTEEKWGFATTISNGWEKPGGRGAGFWGHLLLPKPRILRQHNAMLDEFIAQADRPALAQAEIGAPSLLTFPNTISYPLLPRALWNNERRQTNENLLLLRLALRAYRVENGSYPIKIAALHPKYLAAIPVDPFGRGEAMRYRKLGDSYTLWSIGPDKIDNHGAPILNKLGQKPRFFVPESRGDVTANP